MLSESEDVRWHYQVARVRMPEWGMAAVDHAENFRALVIELVQKQWSATGARRRRHVHFPRWDIDAFWLHVVEGVGYITLKISALKAELKLLVESALFPRPDSAREANGADPIAICHALFHQHKR
jgi:hypothetical protein